MIHNLKKKVTVFFFFFHPFKTKDGVWSRLLDNMYPDCPRFSRWRVRDVRTSRFCVDCKFSWLLYRFYFHDHLSFTMYSLCSLSRSYFSFKRNGFICSRVPTCSCSTLFVLSWGGVRLCWLSDFHFHCWTGGIRSRIFFYIERWMLIVLFVRVMKFCLIVIFIRSFSS